MEKPNSENSSKRESYEKRFKLEAGERNGNRTLSEKLFLKNSSAPIDLAREEAERVNDLLGTVGSDSPQVNSDRILEGKEFGAEAGSPEDAQRIKFREWLRAKFPDSKIGIEIERAIELGNIREHFIKQIGESMNESEEKRFIEGIKSMVSDKIDTMIRANDRVAMMSVLEDLNQGFDSLELVAAPDIARMPINVLTPYKTKVSQYLEKYLKETLYPEPIVKEVLGQLELKTS